MKTFTKTNLASVGTITALTFALFSCQKEVTSIPEPTAPTQASQQFRTAAIKDAAYELVWSDDFDSGLDPAKWRIVTGDTDVHHELQAYDSTSVKAGGGFLSILAEKRATLGKEYRSGKVSTQGKFSIRYGRIEARIKLPYAIGLASEFSMQGTSYPELGLPYSGEIDIMQHVNRDFNVLGGIQWENAGHAIYRGASPASAAPGYHVYAVEWDRKDIRWYIDGQQYWTANISDSINSTEEFQKDFFINLNMAVGGDLAGMNIDKNLPTSMGVDYIKVYKAISDTVK